MKLTKYGPKGAYSPSLHEPCVLCGHPLAQGDYTTLIKDVLDRSRFADNGREVHWRCAMPDATTA